MCFVWLRLFLRCVGFVKDEFIDFVKIAGGLCCYSSFLNPGLLGLELFVLAVLSGLAFLVEDSANLCLVESLFDWPLASHAFRCCVVSFVEYTLLLLAV